MPLPLSQGGCCCHCRAWLPRWWAASMCAHLPQALPAARTSRPCRRRCAASVMSWRRRAGRCARPCLFRRAAGVRCPGPAQLCNLVCPASPSLAQPCRPATIPHPLPVLQLLIVGDFNIPAEPRDMHPSLGPYGDSYGEEERAALAGLTAAYPGAAGAQGAHRGLVRVRPSGLVGGRLGAACACCAICGGASGSSGWAAPQAEPAPCNPCFPSNQTCGGGCTPRRAAPTREGCCCSAACWAASCLRKRRVSDVCGACKLQLASAVWGGASPAAPGEGGRSPWVGPQPARG